ncbi:MAG TPA: nucleotidyltransferase domain-containing protein [Actinomycetota bacterium]|nr:nucleotidyltransferase domain-containing protein [Actinomycetota bacterium]
MDKTLRPQLPTIVDEVVEALVSELAPEKVILFGSAARGELTGDSDLDFIVVVSELSKQREEVTRAYRALRTVRGRPPVDVLVYSHQDLEDWGDVIGHPINDALTEGRLIYDAA